MFQQSLITVWQPTQNGQIITFWVTTQGLSTAGIPVVVQPWGVYVAGQVGKECTEFLLKLLATVLVVRVFQAVIGHQIGATRQLSLF